MAIIAKRMGSSCKIKYKQLILLVFLPKKDWHADCNELTGKLNLSLITGYGHTKMNMILTALNAAALVALVTVHFQGLDTANQQANIEIHSGLHQVPRLAVMTDNRDNRAMLTNEAQQMPEAKGSATQRWVF